MVLVTVAYERGFREFVGKLQGICWQIAGNLFAVCKLINLPSKPLCPGRSFQDKWEAPTILHV
ncbi:hypothetical protein HanIR_Chr13g0637651 [Helianthus annuus]|nr:hypothetical protein HanIR_Chr13g0637651 [Helianthus annuus]